MIKKMTKIIINKSFNKIPIRCMWKPPSPNSIGNTLFRLQSNTIQKADMGRFSAVRYSPDVVKENGTALDKHEVTHYSVLDKETGELIALLTSSKNGSYKLSPEKLNGTIIETTDAEWNPIPDPTKGGQYIRFYGTIRVVHKDIVKEYPPGSFYLEKHESKIEYWKEKANLDNHPRERRMTLTEYLQDQQIKTSKENNNIEENNNDN